MREHLEVCRSLPSVADVRASGAIGFAECHEPVNVAELQRAFVAHGVWIRPFRKLVCITPPYISSPDDLQADVDHRQGVGCRMTKLDFVEHELERRHQHGLFRSLTDITPIAPAMVQVDDRQMVNFSSNDYLGLSEVVRPR